MIRRGGTGGAAATLIAAALAACAFDLEPPLDAPDASPDGAPSDAPLDAPDAGAPDDAQPALDAPDVTSDADGAGDAAPIPLGTCGTAQPCTVTDGKKCCVSSTAPTDETCVAAGSLCSTGTSMDCASAADCTNQGYPVCCLERDSGGRLKGSRCVGATACSSSAGATNAGYVVCDPNTAAPCADAGQGTTCAPSGIPGYYTCQ